MQTTAQDLAEGQFDRALKTYHSRHVDNVHRDATEGKSNIHRGALHTEALALCGSSYHRVSRRRWSQAALTYLKLFI